MKTLHVQLNFNVIAARQRTDLVAVLVDAHKIISFYHIFYFGWPSMLLLINSSFLYLVFTTIHFLSFFVGKYASGKLADKLKKGKRSFCFAERDC